ncbi:restriction endonuclease [uncultured Actinomyces sp.]|uniref:restriction endonuclease n=1 Tax=uncultured Actinomyces sp. TaxID=249061 RepID=UPI0028891F29|nr:restriction endonuclease [uncultured Actinomyces sp.]
MMTDNTPTIDQFRPVVLQVLADGSERPFREICELVANQLQLSEQVRSERIASGQARYINRINWACSGLTQAGLLKRPRRGHYLISPDGLSVNARGLTKYSENDMMEWKQWRDYQEEIAARKQDTTNAITRPSDTASDPIEIMEASERTFNAQTETALRQLLQSSSPEFFEKAVIDLLWAMGYGGTHGEKQHVGRSGDGGIDGVIRQDALGLTNVYIQAKRYADTNKVGEPEIRNFIGSLDSRAANRGVFITTSSFLPGAKTVASNYRHGKIVLIDGIKLTALMLAYGVGVHRSEEFVLYEIDDDFFDEELS